MLALNGEDEHQRPDVVSSPPALLILLIDLHLLQELLPCIVAVLLRHCCCCLPGQRLLSLASQRRLPLAHHLLSNVHLPILRVKHPPACMATAQQPERLMRAGEAPMPTQPAHACMSALLHTISSPLHLISSGPVASSGLLSSRTRTKRGNLRRTHRMAQALHDAHAVLLPPTVACNTHACMHSLQHIFSRHCLIQSCCRMGPV